MLGLLRVEEGSCRVGQNLFLPGDEVSELFEGRPAAGASELKAPSKLEST